MPVDRGNIKVNSPKTEYYKYALMLTNSISIAAVVICYKSDIYGLIYLSIAGRGCATKGCNGAHGTVHGT